VNPVETILRSLLRGFGWGLGRRAASRVPLWVAIAVVVGLYLMGVR
jgi:hypothetical protein